MFVIPKIGGEEMIVREIEEFYSDLEVSSFNFALFVPYFLKESHSKRRGKYCIEYQPPIFKSEVKISEIHNFYAFFSEFESTDLAIGFTSKIKLKGNKSCWLKLIDFKCGISEENLGKVKTALKLLKTGPGLILNSGNSYHFYGARPFFNYQEWRKFYQGGKPELCLFEWPKLPRELIGTNWPALTLRQGFAMLRITTCRSKPFSPKIIECFQGGELDEKPILGSPCYERYDMEYQKAIKKLNSPDLSLQERDLLEEDWPDIGENLHKYCCLPCRAQGRLLVCPP